MLSLVSNLNEMEGESDCEAGGECIINEEHRTEDKEAVFRRVYDYLMEKNYPDGLSKDVKRAVRKEGTEGTVVLHLLFMTKYVLKSCI